MTNLCRKNVKISTFPEGHYFGPNYFHNSNEKSGKPQFSRHYDNNAVNMNLCLESEIAGRSAVNGFIISKNSSR